jgi:RNA polymerase sigma-70 factor (ECF subfamily)
MYPEDRQLVRLLLKGDEVAFREFFGDYFPRLFRFILRRVGSGEDAARDIVQAALARAIRKLHLYRGEASLFTWLCQIARHELADHGTRSRRQGMPELVAREEDSAVRAALESMPADPALEPENVRDRDEMAELVHAALDYLPQRYAQVLELKYLEDLSVENIARRLETSGAAVQSLLARARTAFREVCVSLHPELRFTDGVKDERV